MKIRAGVGRPSQLASLRAARIDAASSKTRLRPSSTVEYTLTFSTLHLGLLRRIASGFSSTCALDFSRSVNLPLCLLRPRTYQGSDRRKSASIARRSLDSGMTYQLKRSPNCPRYELLLALSIRLRKLPLPM